MVPLTLALGPIEVSPPGITKKTVHILHIKKDIQLSKLAHIAQLPPARVLIPEADTEEPPEDLFPDGVIKDRPRAKTQGPGTAQPSTSPEDSELFPEEAEEIPQIDEELKGWMIVKDSVKQLNLTDGQIRKWFSQASPPLEVGLEDFAKAIPPEKMTNDLLSKFQAMLDVYRERQKEKERNHLHGTNDES